MNLEECYIKIGVSLRSPQSQDKAYHITDLTLDLIYFNTKEDNESGGFY